MFNTLNMLTIKTKNTSENCKNIKSDIVYKCMSIYTKIKLKYSWKTFCQYTFTLRKLKFQHYTSNGKQIVWSWYCLTDNAWSHGNKVVKWHNKDTQRDCFKFGIVKGNIMINYFCWMNATIYSCWLHKTSNIFEITLTIKIL